MPSYLPKKNKLLPLLVMIYMLSVHESIGQSASDKNLILEQKFEKHEYHKHKRKFLLLKKNVFLKYNPVSLSLGGLMYFYQNVMSPQLGSNCGYEISCSNFSKEVITEFGIIKGMALTADRLMRCNEFMVIDLKSININANNRIVDPPVRYRMKNYPW